MNSLSSLGWWISTLPSVIEEVSIAKADQDDIVQSWKAIVSSSDEGVKRVSRVCEVFDKWLEGAKTSPRSRSGVSFPDFENHDPILCVQVYSLDSEERELFENITQAVRNCSPETLAPVIKAIRTLCLGLKKWKIDDSCTRSHRRDACYSDFISRQECDLVVQRDFDNGELGVILAFARHLIHRVLGDFEEQLLDYSRPRVGPGAVAEGWTPLQKWGRLSPKGHWYFTPLLDHRDDAGDPTGCSESPSEELGVARLCAVPKDRWRDRVITVEPNVSVMCQMMCRQAMLVCMARAPCTRHLRPDRQDWQQEAAIRGSQNADKTSSEDVVECSSQVWETGPHKSVKVSGQMLFNRESTLDFTDASDMITHELITYLFPQNVMAALNSCRSFYVGVTEGREERLVPLRSYAGMGNATTFVIETLVFWAVTYAQLALFRGIKTPGQAFGLMNLAGQVKVYGDDLIVPADLCVYSKLIRRFEELGWKLNASKSFYRIDGSFRESCGVHAFRGEDVTPIRFEGYDVKSHTDQVAVADKIRAVAEVYPLLARKIFDASQLPNTHVPGNLGGRAALNHLDWPEKTPLPVRWNSRLQILEIRCTQATPLQEKHKRGFSELLLASLCGFHYYVAYVKYDRTAQAIRKCGSKGRRLSLLCYRSPMPRRVTLSEEWFPTIPWGVDLDAIDLR